MNGHGLPPVGAVASRSQGPAEPNTDRETNLARLRAETFDLAIIGGGITGAAVARDAAMRGLKTAMVDKGDFACATSSHSSKLIHGGLRYLPQGQLRLVYHALRERERLRHITAPHLVHPIKFLFPFYRGRRPSRTAVYAGLIFYDLFARTPPAEKHRRLSRNEVSRCEPALEPEGLTGGAIYLDATGDDARITLENVLDAAYHGAAVANYVTVEGVAHAGQGIAALYARDVESGAPIELRARAFVNAAGPWVEQIRRMDEQGCEPLVRLTKGVHIVVESSHLPVRNSLVLADNHNRIIFLIRYDNYVLIGTTDTDFVGSCEPVPADVEDAEYLLDVVNQSVPDARLSQGHIAACFAGLRTLRISRQLQPSSAPREELIAVSRSGLITVAGGKLTTHREIAGRVVDRVMKTLGRSYERSPTLAEPLPGARGGSQASGSISELPPELRQILIARYGSRAEIVARIAAERVELAQPLAPGSPAIGAEVIHAVRNEFARTLADFIVRRTAMNWRAPAAALASAPEAARLMAQELGWDGEWKRRELQSLVDNLNRLSRQGGVHPDRFFSENAPV
ncbi:MAG: glycerol-3-phosphate dehydrogenase/oxidase [Deltaproteobacteria bacterium]|nr:glycerol-3-phosphate dehydrogenase/oxidase [Deltaproteobacteria bacterium]